MTISPQTSPAHTRNSQAPPLRIDAHHHLWRFHEAEFAWIEDKMAVLRRDFLVEELCHELQTAKIDGTVAVQARESLEETHWLLECARSTPAIRGVVGWAPLEADDLPKVLDSFHGASKLVGFREIAQIKPDGYLDQPEFNRGIRHLTSRGLTYDILIHERQLQETARFVDRHPSQRFILDHAAKPKIAKAELEPWKANIQELARRPNVSCKISGLATEAHWHSWTLDALRPYLDTCVEAFGSDRILACSDWPVCLLASTYLQWWDTLNRYFAGFSKDEAQRIFGGNAVDVYQLTDVSEVSS